MWLQKGCAYLDTVTHIADITNYTNRYGIPQKMNFNWLLHLVLQLCCPLFSYCAIFGFVDFATKVSASTVYTIT